MANHLKNKWRTILALSLAELLVLVVWFSASAVMPALTTHWKLDESGQSWLTMSVQIGFVVGALASSLLTIADRIPARRLFIMSSVLASLMTAFIPLLANDSPTLAFIFRFLTGVFLAGVYPIGMKLMSTWTQKDRGLGIGLLVGALTVGSAFPHLIRAFGSFGEWQTVLWASSFLAFLGAIIAFFFCFEGPYQSKSPRFEFNQILRVLTNRRVMLANMGYLGHMWELYAMWSWLASFLVVSFALSNWSSEWASLLTFVAIALGGVGSVIAGKVADQIGRVPVTTISMLVSGGCALLIGRFYGDNSIILIVITLVWGFAIVADSAQFSASVSENCDRDLIGTALTLQTSMGFLLTLVSIRLVPTIVNQYGWENAFNFLAIGPVIGIIAMLSLNRLSSEKQIG